MKRIENYSELSSLITSQMKRGMVTNAFLSRHDWEREIEKNAPEFQLTEQGLLVYRNRPTHRILSFWVSEGFFGSCPTLPGNTVCEIPMRASDVRTQSAVDGWIGAGFELEFTRQRMASAESGNCDGSIRTAVTEDLDLCERLMRENFSRVTGCLPEREELMADIEKGGVLLRGDCGLLHHRTGEKKTELRHLCVAESARGQGIGEKLVRAYHALTEGMKRQVWVRADYASAVRTYEKCGYSADGMISHVLIRR